MFDEPVPCPECGVPGGHMFGCPGLDTELPDALDVAQQLCEVPWDDLVDEVKLTFVTRAQQYIDVIAPPILEQRNRARSTAAALVERYGEPGAAGAAVSPDDPEVDG